MLLIIEVFVFNHQVLTRLVNKVKTVYIWLFGLQMWVLIGYFCINYPLQNWKYLQGDAKNEIVVIFEQFFQKISSFLILLKYHIEDFSMREIDSGIAGP